MNHHLDRIETHLRNLFEEKLLKIFTGNQPHHTLIEDLVDAMRANILPTESGNPLAPDQYTIHISSENLAEWQSNQGILDQMAESLFALGKRESLIFSRPPAIIFQPDLAENSQQYAISAQISDPERHMPDTASMTQPIENESQPALPQDAYFVIGGTTNFQLTKPVTNIGRHSDNDLALEDLHVSRHHAQLRVIRNHHVIFDVGSTGGVFLNGQQVSQATLHSGDVIRIGTVNLIYIHDTTASHPTTVLSLEDPDADSSNSQKDALE